MRVCRQVDRKLAERHGLFGGLPIRLSFGNAFQSVRVFSFRYRTQDQGFSYRHQVPPVGITVLGIW